MDLVQSDLKNVGRNLRNLTQKLGKDSDRKNNLITALTFEVNYHQKKEAS